MEKKGQYRYTKEVSEVHENVKKLFKKYSGLELANADFVSALWIENFASKGKVFFIVSKNILYNNTAGPFEQISVKSISGVNHVMQIDITTNDGKKYIAFKFSILPEEMRAFLMGDINTARSA